MKKQFYLMLGLCLSTSIILAQTSKQQSQYIGKMGTVASPTNQESDKNDVAVAKGSAVEIWSNGFEDPSQWLIYDESTPALGWEIIDDVTASPVAALNPIMLTGADNGFAFVNGDPAGDGSVQDAWIEFDGDIPLNGAQFISLQFENVSRNYLTTYSVEFSTDGGLSWIPQPVNEQLTINTNTANPEVFNINVSDLIAGNETIRLRFRFQADWGWFWAIDDIQLIETPPYDAVLSAAYFDEYILLEQDEEGYLDTDYIQNIEYNEYRVNHVRPLSFVGEVGNSGSSNLTNVTFKAIVTTPAGVEEFVSDPPLASLAPNESQFIVIENVLLDAFSGAGTVGDYSVDFEINHDNDAEDALPDNNIGETKFFSVNTERMANDQGLAYTGWYNIGQGAIWGSQFMVEEETEVNYVQFVLVDGSDNPTVPGEEVFVNLRQGSVLEAEGPENEMNRFFDEDELSYVIEEGDVSTGGEAIYLTVMFEDPVSLQPGLVYQAEAESPEVGSDIAFFAVSNGQETGAGVLFEFADPSGGPQGWFTLGGNCPNIQAGCAGCDFIGTEELGNLDFFMGQNFPNPVANGSTRISWNLDNPEENIRFSISDNNGKIVYQKDLGDRPAGNQEDIVLDDLRLAAGVYQYGLTIGNQKVVRKMVITK